MAAPSEAAYRQSDDAVLVKALLAPSRLAALAACDVNLVNYDPSSFLVVFHMRGRNLALIAIPLCLLVIWWTIVALLLHVTRNIDPTAPTDYDWSSKPHELVSALESVEAVFTPALSALSFLLVRCTAPLHPNAHLLGSCVRYICCALRREKGAVYEHLRCDRQCGPHSRPATRFAPSSQPAGLPLEPSSRAILGRPHSSRQAR